MGIKIKHIIYFLFLAAVTVYLTHFSTPAISSAWYVFLLILYYISDDEPFWMAFFFTTVDGFMGFLGLYSTTLEAIPGLPGVEVAQLYIVLGLIKVLVKKSKATTFYSKWMTVLLVYTVFLVLYGIAHGLTLEFKISFRIIKITFPLILYFPVPRLIKTADGYARLFSFLFMIFLLGFVQQQISLGTGFNPAEFSKQGATAELEVGRNFRVLYNQGITLITMCGVFYYLSLKGKKPFKDWFLYGLIGIALSAVVLSATRGWIISFTFVTFAYFVFVQRLNFKGALVFLGFMSVFVIAGLTNKTLQTQIQFAFDRLISLESFASGDLTADGTLIRLDERAPLVLGVWEKNPVFGAGFSDTFLETQDFHVGNQNILMHSGVMGYGLLILFMIYFASTLMNRYLHGKPKDIYRLTFPALVLVLIGWFFIHSTSQQLIAYYGLPADIFPLSIFFSLAAFAYGQSVSPKKEETAKKSSYRVKKIPLYAKQSGE